MDLSRTLTDRHEICIKFGVGSRLKPTFEKCSPPPLKSISGEKNQIIDDCRQSEARNIETAQQIDKQVTE